MVYWILWKERNKTTKKSIATRFIQKSTRFRFSEYILKYYLYQYKLRRKESRQSLCVVFLGCVYILSFLLFLFFVCFIFYCCFGLLWFSLVFGPHPPMLSASTWLFPEITPGRPWKSYGILGLEPKFSVCKHPTCCTIILVPRSNSSMFLFYHFWLLSIWKMNISWLGYFKYF